MNIPALLSSAAAVTDRAARMNECEAFQIVTWRDEPALLANPGEAPPLFSAVEVAAARLLLSEIEVVHA